MTTHTLYRFFAADDSLLYVGITNNPARRFSKHKDEKAWWLDVARIELEQHSSRDELLAAERQAVMDERPLHNKAMNVSGKEPGVTQDDPLIGRFFHSWYLDERTGFRQPQTQGIVQEAARDGYFVQYFSWWDGIAIDGQQWESFEDMKEWTFYTSSEEMQIATGCREDFGNGRRFQNREGMCGAPITHVIRDYAGMSPVYRCGECIKFYGGKVEVL